MEKVKVKSTKIKKEGEKNGKKWIIREVEVEKLSDGHLVKGDSFDEFKEDEECEIEIIPNQNSQYNPTFKKAGSSAGGKKGFTKDYTFEKRKTALECAVQMCVAGKVTPDQLVATRDKFFEYLNTK